MFLKLGWIRCVAMFAGAGTAAAGSVLRFFGFLFAAFVPLAVLHAQLNYTTPYTFNHLAGSIAGPGSADGTGTAAQFSVPQGVASDSVGNVYVADTGNHTIRKITPIGAVTTFAGLAGESGSADGKGSEARFDAPQGLAVDAAGNVYVADLNGTIRKITSTGVVSTLAGTANQGNTGSADGTGPAARFSFPDDVAVDSAGNVYVADTSSHTIRKITPTGIVSTLAGTAGQPGHADGTGTSALFNYPTKVAVDGAGNVYVTDKFNNTIRKITSVGVVTTLAGTAGTFGSTDDIGAAARFNHPNGLAVDTGGNVYVTDQYNHTIRKITPAGTVTTLAGLAGHLGNLDGAGATARFYFPVGMTVDGAGNMYVADAGYSPIRKITPTGVVTTLAGPTNQSGSANGAGPLARFAQPNGVAVDITGNVYVADTDNSTIRKITPTGVVTTFAGSAGESGSADGTGSLARFDQPVGVAVDTSGNVYVADSNNTIRKITPAGVVTTLAGMAGVLGFTDGTGSAARFAMPTGVAVDSAGNVYVSDYWSGIRKITPAGVVTTFAGADGSFGFKDGTGGAAQFSNPFGVAVDSAGNVYVADTGNHAIRKITSAGVVTTLAGTLDYFGYFRDGIGTDARFGQPMGVAVDSGGNLYVTDSETIRKVMPDGVVTTVAGTAQNFGNTDGTGSAVQFCLPRGIAVDSAGNIYVGDARNNAIRKGEFVTSAPLITTQPVSQTVISGISVTFTAAASGVPVPTYRWKKGGVDITGATDVTYTIAQAVMEDAGSYTVVATNSVSSATSNPAMLTVNEANTAPMITTQPFNQTVTIGSPVTLTSLASGTPEPTYQWRKGGADISGATGNTYMIASVAAGDEGTYVLVATNSVSSAMSNPATLTVVAPPVITTQPLSQAIIIGNSVTLTVAASGTPTPTFQWKKDGVAINGATNSTYMIASAASGDAGSYTVAATNSVSSVTSSPAILIVTPTRAPVITMQPVSQTVIAGNSITFTVAANGVPLPTFQWKKGGVAIGNATSNTHTIASVAIGDAGSYTVVVTNSIGSVVSSTALLTVVPRAPQASTATGDFDRDGKSDLLWQSTDTGERSIWLMNGTTLTAGVSLGLSPTQWSIGAVADFNGDGKVDLLWQNTLTGERTFWLMNGSTFVSSVELGTYSTDLTIAGAGDFNEDGKPDLVWQNTSTGERSIWLMNGTTIGSMIDLGTFPPEWSIAGTGEFNGDGKIDLIWQNTVTGERALWLMNGTTVTAGVALGVYPQLQVSGTGDYNGDGKSDILWTNVSIGERIIWLMNGTAKSVEVSLGVVSLEWVLNRPVFRRALADFNNDGKSDLVWQNTSTGDRAIWIMNGIEARTGLSLGNYAVDQWIAAIGDFNNDGKADLVWEDRTTGVRSIALMNGTTVLSTVALGTYDPAWKINTTGDFNADGKPDLVWTNSATGARAIWLMDGTAFTAGVDLGTVAVAQQVAGTGDFDGDGKTDILWQNTTTGTRTIWLMNGTTHTSTATLGTYAPEWSIVGTGDYNADGKPDLLWQNTNTGERAIWLMNGTTYLSSAAVGTYDTAWSIRN